MEDKDRYLILDAEHPLICTDRLYDEMILYNLDPAKRQRLYQGFLRITGKNIDQDTALSALSGGQKVILMVLLGLNCPAQRLCLRELSLSLDPTKEALLRELMAKSTKEIIVEGEL